MIILILKVERKKISCKDTEVIKKYPACLKDEKKISSSVENAQPPHQKCNGPPLTKISAWSIKCNSFKGTCNLIKVKYSYFYLYNLSKNRY